MRFLVLLAPIALVAAGAAAGEPPVGFVCHYPWIDVGMDELPKSGASALITRAVFGMEPEEGKFDFSSLDRQIAYAEEHNLKLVLLLECNPVYAPPWLKAKVKAAGQAMRRADGTDHTMPSITSPIFREAQAEFVRRTIEHVRQADKNRVITHYQAGAEWWFEMVARYHPEDIAQFRRWLTQRYATIDRLNRAWESQYASFDEVPAPRLDLADWGQRDGLARLLAVDVPPQDCSWSTRQGFAPEVTPGKTYTFSAWVRTEDAVGRGAHLAISWLAKDSHVPYHEDWSEGVKGTTGWRRISLTIEAPPTASRAWLLLKMRGFGAATFDSVEFHEEGSTGNLVLNPSLDAGAETPGNWFFDNWLGGKGISGDYLTAGGRDNSRCVRISIPHPDSNLRTYRDQNVAANDWSVYWAETAAEYVNSLARMVKRLDPSRPTATYLTFSFAFPAEWDYVQSSAIQPDEVALRGHDIDVMGMQICSADGDPFRATACLDLVRKYGKPMWAVDLLDFTSGVRIGYPAMDKVTQAAIQHGAAGIFYYCWHGTRDYEFHPDMPIKDLNRMLTDARTAIRLLEGMSIDPRVAIVQPILPASPEDADGFKNDYRSFIGWYKILEGLHQTFDVVTLREIELRQADLSQYEWILVPDCAYLPRAARWRLDRYLRGGGRLIISGRFAEFDEVGSPLSAKSLRARISYRPGPGAVLALPDYGKAYTGTLVRDTRAGNTPPLFLWRQETAATRKAFQAARSALREFFRDAGIRQEVELLPDNPAVRCTVFDGRGKRAAYLVNMAEAPAEGVRLRLRSPRPSDVRVYADTEPVPCLWRHESGWTEIDLPEFRTSLVVRLSVPERRA